MVHLELNILEVGHSSKKLENWSRSLKGGRDYRESVRVAPPRLGLHGSASPLPARLPLSLSRFTTTSHGIPERKLLRLENA